jgi:hypothetical protein
MALAWSRDLLLEQEQRVRRVPDEAHDEAGPAPLDDERHGERWEPARVPGRLDVVTDPVSEGLRESVRPAARPEVAREPGRRLGAQKAQAAILGHDDEREARCLDGPEGESEVGVRSRSKAWAV